jgi:leader peptidase (prepilin peptidase)/N-methyltransferase
VANLDVAAPLRPRRALVSAAVALAAAAAVVAARGISPWSAVEAGTAMLLVWVAAIDVETRLLPDRIVLPAAAGTLAAVATLRTSELVAHSAAALAAGGLMLVAAAIRPGDLGMGDAKLALLLGALLGGAVLRAMAVGFGLVAVVGVVLVVRHGRAGLKRRLPLGPFLAAGAIATLVLGTG